MSGNEDSQRVPLKVGGQTDRGRQATSPPRSLVVVTVALMALAAQAQPTVDPALERLAQTALPEGHRVIHRFPVDWNGDGTPGACFFSVPRALPQAGGGTVRHAVIAVDGGAAGRLMSLSPENWIRRMVEDGPSGEDLPTAGLRLYADSAQEGVVYQVTQGSKGSFYAFRVVGWQAGRLVPLAYYEFWHGCPYRVVDTGGLLRGIAYVDPRETFGDHLPPFVYDSRVLQWTGAGLEPGQTVTRSVDWETRYPPEVDRWLDAMETSLADQTPRQPAEAANSGTPPVRIVLLRKERPFVCEPPTWGARELAGGPRYTELSFALHDGRFIARVQEDDLEGGEPYTHLLLDPGRPDQRRKLNEPVAVDPREPLIVEHIGKSAEVRDATGPEWSTALSAEVGDTRPDCALSPIHHYLAYSTMQGIGTTHREGTGDPGMVVTRDEEDAGAPSSPAWSRDDSLVSYICHLSHGSTMAVMDIWSHQRTHLAFSPGQRGWSPAANRLAVVSRDGAYPPSAGQAWAGEFVVLDAPDMHASVRLRLTDAIRTQFEWAPDGKSLAVLTCPGTDLDDRRLLIVDADSGQSRELARGCLSACAWSPTGEWIAVEQVTRMLPDTKSPYLDEGPQGPAAVRILRSADGTPVADLGPVDARRERVFLWTAPWPTRTAPPQTDAPPPSGEALALSTALLRDDATFVPARALLEWLGAQVSFDAGVLTATRGSEHLRVRVGGGAGTGAAVPFVEEGMTYIPVRLAAEAFGAQLEYRSAERLLRVVAGEESMVVPVRDWKSPELRLGLSAFESFYLHAVPGHHGDHVALIPPDDYPWMRQVAKKAIWGGEEATPEIQQDPRLQDVLRETAGVLDCAWVPYSATRGGGDTLRVSFMEWNWWWQVDLRQTAEDWRVLSVEGDGEGNELKPPLHWDVQRVAGQWRFVKRPQGE
ncbi:MAG: hypothetical protein KBA64_05290 [Armatimonadetes bacterium]|nr:hypothetical protein [Armatimonadota bacterium]